VRKRRADSVTDLWRWWAGEGAALALAGIGSGEFGRFPQMVTARVHRIDENLAWELGPGSEARHCLCITGEGVPELRVLAERVVREAPPADATWEYSPARRGSRKRLQQTLQLGPHAAELSLTRVRLELDDSRQLLRVGTFHPVFPAMTEQERGQFTFLVLDWALGEDEVERWLGTVEHLPSEPTDSLPIEALIETVEGLAGRRRKDTWAVLKGTGPGGAPLLALAIRPLKWIDSPLLDLHLEVSLPYQEVNAADMPTNEALERLRAAQDELESELGSDSKLVAVDTSAKVRRLHLYADSEDGDVLARVTDWVARYGRGARLTTHPDPGWRQVRSYA
jgi:hypothetical protein